jgi:hypothetical protein
LTRSVSASVVRVWFSICVPWVEEGIGSSSEVSEGESWASWWTPLQWTFQRWDERLLIEKVILNFLIIGEVS